MPGQLHERLASGGALVGLTCTHAKTVEALRGVLKV